MRAGIRYGILGGTFDPPHFGHLALAQEAAVRLALDRVWFTPAAEPPHKRDVTMSEAQRRVAMVEQAIAGNERFGLERVDLDRPGPSYTIETLDLLRQRWGSGVWIGFIVGWDMLTSLPTWREPSGVLDRLDALIAARRPGYSAHEVDATELDQLESLLPGLRRKLILLDAPLLDLSSTELRQRVAQGLPVRYLTPDPVCAYISHQGLYAPTTQPIEESDE